MASGNPVAELFLVEARAWFSVFREEYLPRFVNDPLFWSLVKKAPSSIMATRLGAGRHFSHFVRVRSQLEEIGSYKADLVNVALFIQETVSTVSVSRHTSEDTSRNAGRNGDQPGVRPASNRCLTER